MKSASLNKRTVIPDGVLYLIELRATKNGRLTCECGCEKAIEPVTKEFKDKRRMIHLKTVHRGYEIDHIVPLRLGGTNEPDNLKLLALACHKLKTKKERDLWMNPGKFRRADPLRENRYGPL